MAAKILLVVGVRVLLADDPTIVGQNAWRLRLAPLTPPDTHTLAYPLPLISDEYAVRL